MVANPPEDMPRVAPYLFYEDVAAALDWLGAAFGFTERMRLPGPDGGVGHAEMSVGGDAVIMMGHPGPEYKSPKRSGENCQMNYVYVEDVDSHCERARAAGAEITEEPDDQFYGDRRYSCADLEGQLWSFATHTKDVDPADYPSA